MGESHLGPATAPDCQPLTEQPGKDLQSMGKGSVGDFSGSRLCTFAGPGGEVRALVAWRLCAVGQVGPVVHVGAGKARRILNRDCQGQLMLFCLTPVAPKVR